MISFDFSLVKQRFNRFTKKADDARHQLDFLQEQIEALKAELAVKKLKEQPNVVEAISGHKPAYLQVNFYTSQTDFLFIQHKRLVLQVYNRNGEQVQKLELFEPDAKKLLELLTEKCKTTKP